MRISEEKIISIRDFDPVKYHGTKMVISVMEWLRYHLLDKDSSTVKAPLDIFLSQTSLDKNRFLTFVKEVNDGSYKGKVNFDVKVEGDDVIFSGISKNTTVS